MKVNPKTILLLFITLILLPSMLATTEDIKRQINSITHYAAQYETGNIEYAKAIVKINQAESALNLLLGGSEKEVLTKEELASVFGEPQQTTWELDKETEQQTVASWHNTIFDGNKLNVKTSVVPVSIDVDGKEILAHKADVSVILANTQVDLDPDTTAQNIENLENLAKTYVLDPNPQTQNQLASEISTLEKIFDEHKQQSTQTCEEFFTATLGKESIKSEQMVVNREFLISDIGDIKTIAKLSYCEKCEKDNWINLKFVFTDKEGREINYPLIREPLASLYEDYEENMFKADLIDFMNTFVDLVDAKSYKAANSVGTEMSLLIEIWNLKGNEETAQAGLNFLNMLSFSRSLLKNYPEQVDFVKTIEFEKTLFEKVKEEKEEVCYNKIDDNENDKIDCEDDLCNGKFCGETTVDLYCIRGSCEEKEEPNTVLKNITCGNGVCEEGEIETCPADCVTCPEIKPVNCQGDLIPKGVDKNGCLLEPICLKSSDSCTIDSDCETPLCGKVQCIAGECHTISFEQCTQAKCVDGEKQVQKCINGEEITTAICMNKIWKDTGQTCESPTGEPIETSIEEKGEACEKKEDCIRGICSNGVCTSIPINTKTKQETTQQTSATFKGTTVTGKIIEITGEGITGTGVTGEPITGTGVTGIVGDPENPEAYQAPVDYARSYSERTGEPKNSLFTISLSPSEKEEEELAKIPPVQAPERPLTIELGEERIEFLAVKGFCTETKDQKNSEMVFEGIGETLTPLNSLKQNYNEKNIAYCDWMLEQALLERKAIEQGFTLEFIEEFFETHIANNAEDLTIAKQELINLFNKIVKNQEAIAEMMACSGIAEHSEYNTIKIDYENENLGILKYEEEVKNIRMEGSLRKTKIISPIMKVSIFPTTEFIRENLATALTNHEFIGSSESIAQRTLGSGFTQEERQALENNQELVSKIQTLANSQGDNLLNFHLKIIDEENKEVYGLYGILGGQDLIKVAPMSSSETPAVNVKIRVGFNEILDVLKTSEKSTEVFELRPSWDSGGLNPIKTIKTAINGIKTRLKMNSLMNSINLTPKNNELKDILEQLFYIVAEGEQIKETSTESSTQLTFWDQEGKETTI
jgi:hypothetical protein